MKKLLSMILVLYILGSIVCFAADSKLAEKPTVISMDTIGQIWTENSRDLVKYRSELFTEQNTYDHLVRDTDAMSNDSMGSINMGAYNAMFDSRDQANLSFKIAQLQFTKNIQNAQLEAKKMLLTCWQDEINVNVTQKSLAIKQSQLKSEGILVQQGYISQHQYDKTKTAVDSIQANLDSLKLQQETDQISLKSKLGLKPDTAVQFTYPDLSKEKIARLVKMNYDTDLKTYMKNSVSLKVLEVIYDSKARQRPYATYAQIEDAKVDLENAQTNMPKGFKVTYNNFMNEYKNLVTSYNQLQDEVLNYSMTITQYKLGVVKFMDYSNAGLTYASVEAQVKSKEISLYNTYLTYLNMVAGN